MTGLYASRSYAFQLCGADDGGGATVCAQTRTFTTEPAVQDSVVGYWTPSPHFNGSVDAHSGSSAALGTIAVRDQFDTFTGTVTCLFVDGNKAAVSAVGNVPGEPTARETLLARFVDGGPSSHDGIGIDIQPGTFPPDCSSVSFENLNEYFGQIREVVVNDAP